jgi:S1-C subfamily serine protease
MFGKAVAGNREAIYAILGSPPLPPNAITPSLGTAFMVAPGLLVTAARCALDAAKPGAPHHGKVQVIRAPDIGRKAEPATVIAADTRKDLALLRIDAPRSTACLKMLDAPVPVGTHCGTSGFPRIAVDSGPVSGVSLIELFQGADISSFVNAADPNGDTESRYETDSPLCGDSSGCPGFVASGEVFGMFHQCDRDPRPGVSFWVPSMEIIAFLKDNGVMPLS